MWQKRTDQEMAEVRRQARRNRKILATLLGIFISVICIFTRGKGGWLRHGSSDVSWQEVPLRIPVALVGGLLTSLIFYRFCPPSKRTVICPHCDKPKFDDGVTHCSCGRDFVDIETVKWV
jgi:hypothetical protein